MGKTVKGKAKAEVKIAKAKRKIARKCKGKCAALVAAVGLAMLCGCATSDSAQPAKSQTQSNTFDDCVFIMAAKATVSNGVLRAEGDSTTPLEMFTQTQVLESSGTESFAQTATQTPTTDVKPDLDVHYNDAIKGATDASKGVLETLVSSSANKVLSMMASKESGTVEVTKTDGSTATVKCEDGQCSFCTDDSCSP